MEPTAADVAAIQSNLDGAQPISQPAPQQAPQVAPQVEPQAPQPQAQPQAPQQQPTQPVAQPAPTSQPQDPFSTLFAPAPAEQQPTQQPEQVPTQQPQQPVEPQVQPPVQQAPVQNPAPQYQTFDEYMESVTQGVGEEVATPDPSKIDPNDEAGIKSFFDDLVETAVKKASQATARTTAIQNVERQLWDEAMGKYGSLRSNKDLRDMVHAVRMNEFNKGIAITPTQAADRVLEALQKQYNRGVADNQVVTTIQSVQPTGGGGTDVQTTSDMDNVYTQIQNGGETALAAFLDTQVKNGKL